MKIQIETFCCECNNFTKTPIDITELPAYEKRCYCNTCGDEFSLCVEEFKEV